MYQSDIKTVNWSKFMPAFKARDITQNLRSRIQNGEWSAAAVLPNERALAEEFGVARGTIRNAFKALEIEGLISRHVGRGTIVKEKASDDLLKILNSISGASPLDILNLRLIIEPQAAATATSHASAQDIESIRDADMHASTAYDLESYEYWDNEFHRRIYVGTHNEFLVNLFSVLSIIRHRAPMNDIRVRTFTEARRLEYCTQHQLILDALQARNAPKATQEMRSHLMLRRRIYFGE
jgi:DNA-binding FadR family transcriptional regulator